MRMNMQIYGEVVRYSEDRVGVQSSDGKTLIPGDSQVTLDLLLRNAKGHEMALRVAVPEKIAEFYAQGA